MNCKGQNIQTKTKQTYKNIHNTSGLEERWLSN